MKKWLSWALVAVLLFGLTACGERTSIHTDESSADSRIATDQEITQIQSFLNDPANNGFVGYHYYTAPEKASPHAIFYDGAGVGTFGTADWSEQEKKAVLAATGWDTYYNPPLKISRSEVEQVLHEKLGLSSKELETNLNESFCYVEAYDSYYMMHGDTNSTFISVTRGRVEPNDMYVVEYTFDSVSEEHGVVTLLKTNSGFQFVSNVKK